MRSLAFILILILTSLSGQAAELVRITWPTVHAAPAIKLSAPASDLLPAFRLALGVLPEESIVAMALSQPSLLGLTAGEANQLKPLAAARYRLMAKAPPYHKAASALAYCFSELRPQTGLASVYVPEGATGKTPVILFLHGYGGSFLWYQHYLSELFADHIIICPAHGISTAAISQAYVEESLTATAKKLGFPLAIPSLVGLSDGGFGVCRLCTAAPRRFARMICLASFPPDDTLVKFTRDAQLCFLSGGAEPFVISGDLNRRVASIRRSCPAVELAAIPDAGHFFLLTHPKQSEEHLLRWIASGP